MAAQVVVSVYVVYVTASSTMLHAHPSAENSL